MSSHIGFFSECVGAGLTNRFVSFRVALHFIDHLETWFINKWLDTGIHQ